MTNILDDLRRQLGIEPELPTVAAQWSSAPPPAQANPVPSLADVARAGRPVTSRFPDGVRACLALTAMVAAVVAGVHQVAFEAWSHSPSHLWRYAADLAGWPNPLFQTLLAAASAAAIAVVAAATWGFTRVTPYWAWAAVVAAAAAALASLPCLIVFAVAAALFALIIIVAVAVFVGLAMSL